MILSVEKIEKVDDYTVKITTPGPSAILLNDLCHHGNAIVPKKLLDEGHDFATDPVGSGPYKFVSWKRGDSLEFEAFEDYFRKIHMPVSLRELGINPSDKQLDELADKAVFFGKRTLGAFKVLQRDDIREIYRQAR